MIIFKEFLKTAMSFTCYSCHVNSDRMRAAELQVIGDKTLREATSVDSTVQSRAAL